MAVSSKRALRAYFSFSFFVNENTPYLEFSQLPRPLAAFFVVNAIHHGAHYGFFRVRVWINLKHKEIN
jgi:hypothetical protein